MAMTESTQKISRAVFLDRDGTINTERGYLHRVEDFEFIPGVPQAMKKLQDASYLLVVVTNQSGVARRFFTLESVQRLHRYMCFQLKGYGVNIDAIYFCPHHPISGYPPYNIACDCRKGKPGMLLQASGDLSIDLSQSYMIGDKMADIEAGVSAGCHSLLVGKGYIVAGESSQKMQCEGCFQALPEAVDYILGRNSRPNKDFRRIIA